MSIQFKSIFIPVDFSINTEIAVKKGLELVEDSGATIHLIHVLTAVIPAFTLETYFPNQQIPGRGPGETARKKLQEWKQSILDTVPDIKVEIHLLKGHHPQGQVANLAKKLQPQLIIIGKHNYHNWFSFLNTFDPGKLGN